MINPSQSDGISVVIPVYNGAWCIEKALTSVLKQSQQPLEIIAVDDGSTDDTARILSDYNNSITLLRKPNGGLSSARNAGINAAHGAWVAFLDADDYWLPSKLEEQKRLIDSNPAIGFCSTATRVEDMKGKALNVWECPVIERSTLHTIFTRNAAVAGSGSSVMARRDLLLQVGLFDEELRSLEDIDLWLRLAAVTEYDCIAIPLTVIRKSDNSMSQNLDIMRESALKVMKKNRPLLDRRSRGGFWQAAYATVLADYAKWEYRVGRKAAAIRHLLEGIARSPFRRGRLLLSLLLAILTGHRL